MGVIRRLVTVIDLQADKAAKALVKYDALWRQTAKSIASYASEVEADANRVVAATQRMAAAVNAAPRPGRGGGAPMVSGLGTAPRSSGARPARAQRGGDDLDRAIAAANKAENARAAGQAKASAQMAGFATGSKSINEATAALGAFATKSERARAAVRDLEAQVARNRKEMADLRAQTLATGDADGTLADRMRGLSVATGQTAVKLADARKELRSIDGSLIDAVKGSKAFSLSLGAMAVAAGNFASQALSRVVQGVAGAMVGATEKAIKFESSFADVKKVLPDNMSVAQVAELEAGIKRLGPAVGVLPTSMAELTAGLAQAGVAGDDLLPIAEDAAKIGVAFDLTGKEAGHAFASIQAALGTTRTETNSLFDTINQLSNGMNSTAAQLVEVEQRVGSVGRAMSLSGETIAALGSALVSTGASAEVAATGVRTFLARLGAGEAATDKQLAAFKALGLSATDVARELSSGDTARAEKQIRGVVEAIQGLSDEDRLPVLIEMFGSESIGTIGALATNVELLGTAFSISGNKAAAAGSVQKEFENRSKTTEHQVQKLKASVEVLAISFGEALMPHINKVVEFLLSPEGQKWGKDAVDQAAEAVSGLATVVGVVAKGLGALIDTFGGTGTAALAMGAAFALALGPWGALAAAAVTAIGLIGAAIRDTTDETRKMEEEVTRLAQTEIVKKQLGGTLGEDAENVARLRAGLEKRKADSKRSQSRTLTPEGIRRDAEKRAADIEEIKVQEALIAEAEGRINGKKKAAEDAAAKAAEAEAAKAKAEADRESQRISDEIEFDALKGKKNLTPSQKARRNELSKALDKAVPSGGGRAHKATKMDKQLAAMDPGVRALLTRGGETDAGGDLKRADNPLDRAVFANLTRSGRGGSDSSPGPGPNVTTIYNTTNNNVQVNVDASSSAAPVENMRQAAVDLGNTASNVRFTGVSKLAAAKNAGGRMA